VGVTDGDIKRLLFVCEDTVVSLPSFDSSNGRPQYYFKFCS